MRRLLAACALVMAAIFVVGFVRGDASDPMRLSALVEKRLITVVVTMPAASDRYRWLSVYGCSAEITENGAYCSGYWEMESTRELYGLTQEMLTWRDVPPGTMKIDAIAFDRNHTQLASARLTILRSE